MGQNKDLLLEDGEEEDKPKKKDKMFKGRTYRGKSSTPLMDEKEEGEGADEDKVRTYIFVGPLIYLMHMQPEIEKN